MPALSLMAQRYPDRIRRRPGAGENDVRRRAAGRQGGPRRATVRGPAGLTLDQALEEAGIDPTNVYVTNAVKHFKNKPRGKRRLPLIL